MTKTSTTWCAMLAAGVLGAGCLGPTEPYEGPAATPDAGADPAPAQASLRLLDYGAPIAAWSFGPRVTGNPSDVLGLTVVNWGQAASGPLALYVTGADPGSFQIASGTDCDRGLALAPGAACILRVRFLPAALGEQHADVIVTDGASRATLGMIGTGVASPLVVSPDVDFGTVSVGAVETQPTTIWNAGTEPLALGAIQVTGAGFQLASTTCGQALDPGASCAATVEFAPTWVGDAKGTLVVTTTVDVASAPVRGAGGGVIRVTRDGDGSGTVTSTDGGLDCGPTCEGAFAHATLLVAAPDPGSVFAGWKDACSAASGPCRVAPGADPVAVTAVFERGPTLTITGGGPAPGEIAVDGQPCTLPCARSFAPGHVVHLEAFTPSAFAGWSGACDGAAPGCDVTMSADRAVGATFAAQTGEQWTAVLGDGVRADRVAFTAGGDLLIGAHDGIGDAFVIAYGTGGEEIWQVRVPSSPDGRFVGLVADGADGAYALDDQPGAQGEPGALVLHHIASRVSSPVKSPTAPPPPTDWARVFEPAAWSGAARSDAVAARPGGGAVALVDDGAESLVVAFDADGTLAWKADVADPMDLAIGGDGVIRVLTRGEGGNRVVARLADDGTALEPEVLASPGGQAAYTSIAAGAGDALLCGITGAGTFTARAVDGAGGASWTADAVAVGGDTAILGDGAGGAVAIDVDTDPIGFALERLDDAGATTWTFGTQRGPRADGSADELRAAGAAAAADGRAAVVGTWARAAQGDALTTATDPTQTIRMAGFVQVYAP